MGSHLRLDTRERAQPQFKQNRPVLDLPTPKKWKAKLTLVLVIYRDYVRRQSPI